MYQIGLGSFGRYGFEKLVEMHNHLEDLDVELAGICDIDFEKREAAEKFAGTHGIGLETFGDVEEMYREASEQDGKILVYDAGPAENHADNIYRSLENGFFHLAEKPPSMRREEHLEEKRLAREHDVFWKVDFIERESPVVRKTLQILEGEQIDRIEVFRESSVGVQKVLQPVERSGVKGGDILDKMVHEVYVLDFLEAAGIEPELELEDADARYLMSRGSVSDRLMTIYGGVTREIDLDTATGQTTAEFSSDGADISLHSSWLGLSAEAEEAAEKVEDITGYNPVENSYKEAGESSFLDQEARFFTVEGSRRLMGDMLHGRLFDLESGEEIDTPDLFHDQLYRVIEKALKKAAGYSIEDISEKEIDVFMNAVFDARETALQGCDFGEELEKARQRLGDLIVSEGKILEIEEAETVPG